MSLMRKLLLGTLLIGTVCSAQTPSNEVRKFLKFDAPVIALTHARIIDGNGGATQLDRTIILRETRLKRLAIASFPSLATPRLSM